MQRHDLHFLHMGLLSHDKPHNHIIIFQKLKLALKEEAENKAHRKLDSFMLVVLSHGNDGIIYGKDGRPKSDDSHPKGCLDINKDILAAFDGNRCPHLHGKPKIILIQACQGSKYLHE